MLSLLWSYERISLFFRLDKRYQKAESSVNKRWKRTNARQGEKSVKEPPNGTPKWAFSDEWKALLEQRKEEAQRYVTCFMHLTTENKKINKRTSIYILSSRLAGRPSAFFFHKSLFKNRKMARFIYRLWLLLEIN